MSKNILISITCLFFFVSSCKKPSNVETKDDRMELIEAVNEDIYNTNQGYNSSYEYQKEVFNELAKFIAAANIDSLKLNIDELLSLNLQCVYDFGDYYKVSSNETFSLVGIACLYNRLDILKFLIAEGADINIGGGSEFMTHDALYYAIYGGNIEMLDFIFENNANANAIYSEAGLVPLVLCCWHNKVEIANYLIDKGAKVDGVGFLGFDYVTIPLLQAIEMGNLDMVNLLLSRGADPLLEDTEGVNAFVMAKNNTEILKFLRERAN